MATQVSDDELAARQCITVAKGEMEKQDFERALSFLERAQRMHSPFSGPTSEATKLVEICNKKLVEQQQQQQQKNSSNTTGGKRQEERNEQNTRNGHTSSNNENPRGSSSHRGERNSSSRKEEGISSQKSDTEKERQEQGPKEGVDYSAEEQNACNEVIKQTDYYKILCVQKSATTEEIKKAYKKLAIKFHPDRCKAPMAQEAFKAVSASYVCLSNGEKRALYDKYGTEDLQRVGMNSSSMGAHRTDGFFYETTPEDEFFDIFAQMFGTDIVHSRARHRNSRYRQQQRNYQHHIFRQQRHDTHGEGQQQQFNCGALLQLAPLFIILLLSLFMQFAQMGSATSSGQSEEIFVFVKSPVHSVQRQCQFGGITYFVKPEFDYLHSRNPRTVYYVDQQVYTQYRNHLTDECKMEKRKKKELLNKISLETDPDIKVRLSQQAEHFTTPMCDEFRRLYGY